MVQGYGPWQLASKNFEQWSLSRALSWIIAEVDLIWCLADASSDSFQLERLIEWGPAGCNSRCSLVPTFKRRPLAYWLLSNLAHFCCTK